MIIRNPFNIELVWLFKVSGKRISKPNAAVSFPWLRDRPMEGRICTMTVLCSKATPKEVGGVQIPERGAQMCAGRRVSLTCTA